MRVSVQVPAMIIWLDGNSNRSDHPNVTGCSTGSSPADAALGGLLEVIERDTFIIAWANRLINDPARRGIAPLIRPFARHSLKLVI